MNAFENRWQVKHVSTLSPTAVFFFSVILYQVNSTMPVSVRKCISRFIQHTDTKIPRFILKPLTYELFFQSSSKSNRTKNTSKMLRYLLGLIYYSNTIFGNISGKIEVISLYCALKCNGAQYEFFVVELF